MAQELKANLRLLLKKLEGATPEVQAELNNSIKLLNQKSIRIPENDTGSKQVYEFLYIILRSFAPDLMLMPVNQQLLARFENEHLRKSDTPHSGPSQIS